MIFAKYFALFMLLLQLLKAPCKAADRQESEQKKKELSIDLDTAPAELYTD
jgi:hypothetical protein